jgi:hypothetical protein
VSGVAAAAEDPLFTTGGAGGSADNPNPDDPLLVTGGAGGSAANPDPSDPLSVTGGAGGSMDPGTSGDAGDMPDLGDIVDAMERAADSQNPFGDLGGSGDSSLSDAVLTSPAGAQTSVSGVAAAADDPLATTGGAGGSAPAPAPATEDTGGAPAELTDAAPTVDVADTPDYTDAFASEPATASVSLFSDGGFDVDEGDLDDDSIELPGMG